MQSLKTQIPSKLNDDIFNMPSFTIKSEKTVEDLLLESDITKEF